MLGSDTRDVSKGQIFPDLQDMLRSLDFILTLKENN